MGESEHWHLDKKVSVGHIVATSVAIVSAVIFLLSQNERITLVERDQNYLRSTVARVEQQQKEQGRELSTRIDVMESRIREDLKEINKSIVTLIERRENERP